MIIKEFTDKTRRGSIVYKLFLSISIIALFVSGCAYNPNLIKNKKLTSIQAVKLNDIMLANLDAPLLRSKADKNKLIIKPFRPKNEVVFFKIKNQTVKAKIMPIDSTSEVSAQKPYILSVKGKTVSLKINTVNKVLMRKTININRINIIFRGFECKNGLELVRLRMVNNGHNRIVKENFKYSNAGNPFEIKKMEIIKNLTVANRYTMGIVLRLKF